MTGPYNALLTWETGHTDLLYGVSALYLEHLGGLPGVRRLEICPPSLAQP